jgi:hypothetical protein
MIFDLKSYSDLGHFSLGTSLEKFDTKSITIYLNRKKVRIKKVEDLFPFLWNSPGMSSRFCCKEHHLYNKIGPWWDDITLPGVNYYNDEMFKQMEQIRRDNAVHKKNKK